MEKIEVFGLQTIPQITQGDNLAASFRGRALGASLERVAEHLNNI